MAKGEMHLPHYRRLPNVVVCEKLQPLLVTHRNKKQELDTPCVLEKKKRTGLDLR
jgi:hypothetical protein